MAPGRVNGGYKRGTRKFLQAKGKRFIHIPCELLGVAFTKKGLARHTNPKSERSTISLPEYPYGNKRDP